MICNATQRNGCGSEERGVQGVAGDGGGEKGGAASGAH